MRNAVDITNEARSAPAKELPKLQMHSVEAYISEDYARAERDRLWRKVWQQAGRVEEIPEVGNYITYDILDDSILIVRTAPDKITRVLQCLLASRPPAGGHAPRAPAARAASRAVRLRLPRLGVQPRRPMHSCAREGDWQGALTERAHAAGRGQGRHLGRLDLDQSGSRIASPCATISSPPPACSIPSSFKTCGTDGAGGSMFDCNWKVAMEAFNETYHVPGTHPEFMKFGDFRGWGRPQGKHSHIGYDAPKEAGENQAKLRLGAGADPRISTAEMQQSIPGTREHQ